MTFYPVRENEAERISALHELGLIGAPKSPDFDAIVALACDLCDVPTALITLVDNDTQWHLAHQGFREEFVERADAFCNHTVFKNRLFVVEDASLDPRFDTHPFVVMPDGMRFYAGVPLEADANLPVGSLCVIDTRPRTLSSGELAQLKRLASIATNLIRQHRDAERVRRLSAITAEYSVKLSEQGRELETQKQLLEDASALGEMGAFEHDMRSGEMRWSDSMKRIHDIEPGEGEFQRNHDFSHLKRFYAKKDLARYIQAIRQAVRDRSTVDMETPIRTARGRKRWVRIRVDFEYENGVPVRRFGMMQDITRHKMLLNRLEYFANRDSLTGLFNRNYFKRHADQFLRSVDSASEQAGMAIIDLDGFKAINDSYGHVAGDACLKSIAKRLKRICGKDDILVRPGGDEFSVLFKRARTPAGLSDFFESVRQAMQTPVPWKGQTFQVTASIGISVFRPSVGATAMGLVQEADLAVYKAKAAGRNCVEFYSPDLHIDALERFDLISRAREALAADAFELFYQPKVSLRDRSHHGFEALLRWRQADGDYVAPGQFMAALDDPEMSRRIGAFVIERAVAQARSWRDAGFAFGHIAVNVSSSQFVGRSFVEDLIAQMEAARLQPGDIQIEVTEDVLLSNGASSVASGLKRLSDYGIKIAFDDFGTGYASLVHLRQLEFDIIKIDMSFVQSMLTSQADMAIVQAVLLLANRLGKTVVAEGVETDTQFDILRAYGCHFAQGYLFSRPVHPDLVPGAMGSALKRAV